MKLGFQELIFFRSMVIFSKRNKKGFETNILGNKLNTYGNVLVNKQKKTQSSFSKQKKSCMWTLLPKITKTLHQKQIPRLTSWKGHQNKHTAITHHHDEKTFNYFSKLEKNYLRKHPKNNTTKLSKYHVKETLCHAARDRGGNGSSLLFRWPLSPRPLEPGMTYPK